ncbi:hypothetical protein BMF94_0334 [Rhodotorula taiwanensis]|uniref:E3 ubiquitin-protein ligase listerin n=1 Tax=Rhodotorula taiwanensis TaxID=741276 RepID=A0A2S5BJ03_9BASI|nr:hypothetical protein BMF94_0334 [Rhodotorula taiwanensis]
MPPKGKSSASSATRKKQAAKAAKKAARDAGDDDEIDVDQVASQAAAAVNGSAQPKQRGQKKVKKDRFAPKVKKYVPPPPPPKGQPDPVDVFLVGRGKQPDPQLVVILRRFVKKDEATLLKGCEGLEDWVKETLRQEEQQEGEDWEREMRQEGVVDCMDVWASHFPRLALHPSRRLRLQVHALHSLLVGAASSRTRTQAPLIASTRSALLAPMWIEKSEFIGAWCTAAHDSDRSVRRDARASWDAVVTAVDAGENVEGIRLSEHADSIASFAFSVVLGGGGAGYSAAGGADTPSSEAGSTSFNTSTLGEDPAFLRSSAISALAYLVQTLPTPLPLSSETVETLLGEELWDLLTRSTAPGARDQPPMVRKALYDLLGAIVGRKDEELLLSVTPASNDDEADQSADEAENDARLRTIAGKVLGNCWEDEEGWPSIILFLRRYPQAWSLADGVLGEAGDDDEDDAPESANGADETFKPSPTVSLFLQHLTLGCSSHPTTLYPTVLLILATIPIALLPPTESALSLLFESFWAAYSSRAIAMGGARAVQAWAEALLEAILFETCRIEDPALSAAIARHWIGERLFALTVGRSEEAKVPNGARTVATSFEQPLGRLAAREDQSAFEAAWDAIAQEVGAVSSEAASSVATDRLAPLASALTAFVGSQNETVTTRGQALALQSLRSSADGIQLASSRPSEEVLDLIRTVGSLLDTDDSRQILDDMARSHLPGLLAESPAALSLFVSRLAVPTTQRDTLWRSLFSPPPAPAVLLRLVDAVSESGLAGELPSADLDSHVREMATRVLTDAHEQADELDLLRRIVVQPLPLVNPSLPSELISRAGRAMSDLVRPVLRIDESSQAQGQTLDGLVAPSALVAHYTQLRDNAWSAFEVPDLAVTVFDVGHALPVIALAGGTPGEAIAAAQQAFSSIVGARGDEAVKAVMAELRVRLADSSSAISTVALVSMTAELLESYPATVHSLGELLPSKPDLEAAFGSVSLAPPAPSLCILDPLVPLAETTSPATFASTFDRSFLSAYGRVLVAVLEVSARDHAGLRRQASWLLPHLLVLSDVARDGLAKPPSAAYASGVFAPDVPDDILARVAAAADGASSYLLSTLANALTDDWHGKAVAHLRVKELATLSDDSDPLLSVLDSLWRTARSGDPKAIYAQRAVRTVLGAVLRYSEDGGAADAERWLALASSSATSAPGLSCAVLYAAKSLLLETPKYERYQNELAADLAGVRPAQLDVKGVSALRLLLAAAPPVDAPVIFLPQQRTMFLIQAITRWIASDEPIPDEMNAGLVELFCHLAPIVQDLSGGHWDLMFDLIESNLESADWEEPATLPAVHHSCLLLAQIRELSTANAQLRDLAKARIDTSLEAVLRLFVSRPVTRTRDQPRIVVVETMAKLVKTLPPKLLSMESSFDQLLRLLQDPALTVQLSSYHLLQRVVEKHVADLVVEAELDAEDKLDIRLPTALVSALGDKPTEDEPAEATAYLLSWLLTFGFFESASPRLRAAFLEQLRDTGLVVDSFLPTVFSLVRLSDRTRPIDLAPWTVDEFHLDLLDNRDRTSMSVLAAHAYYRALKTVPSVIRAYATSLQNLQLSRTLQTFTTRHFSPLLVSDELAVLRDTTSPIGQQLRDNDDFTVKVASNGSEVKVVFIVDEEAMELGIRVPNEFPLAGVEVRDVRKVGVTDKQWRAWLLAMQQVITSQSAAIADAILLFKRNVTLHFEGVESCAICYSTVSTVDRSLPTKTCKTCNNKFHAGCLYKWFTTSHGSTCPLCRQIF